MEIKKIDIFADLQQDYIDHFFDHSSQSIIVGAKGSGKSILMLKLILYAVSRNYKYKITEIRAVFPNMNIEEKSSYNKMFSHLETDIDIKILPSYDDIILESMKMRTERAKKAGRHTKSLLFMDDATGVRQLRYNPEGFAQKLASLRHLGISIIFGIHNIKSVLSTTIRSLNDFLFLSYITDINVLKTIYDEFLGIYIRKFDDFKDIYVEHAERDAGNFILIRTSKKVRLDLNVKEWSSFKQIEKFILDKIEKK
jgi:GTPase SAR1 family protein